ncbi:glycosyltransferase family 2 protein [candidate division TA06 bacterium]|nr:glycosyltransferase family 2 protein [candidate division TA06 bacterium]
MQPHVSIILPVRNEGEFIVNCLQSIAAQDYPKECMELLIVDGLSDDDTLDQIAEFDSGYDDFHIQVLTNTKLTVPHAMNLGISKARGDIILRFDGHAVMEPDYVSSCVKILEQTKAGNVGGPACNIGSGTTMSNAIMLAHASAFGLGGGAFRMGNYEGYTDTVTFGCFPRETFAKYGRYDPRLDRNQDIELNARIRKGIRSGNNGVSMASQPYNNSKAPTPGNIYLTPKIKSHYYCRSTLSGLWAQNFMNGQWVVYTRYIAPYALSLRHFIPLIFVSSLILLTVLSLSGLGANLWGHGAGTRLANALHGIKGFGLKQPGVLNLKAWSWHLLFLRMLFLELFAYFSAMVFFILQSGKHKHKTDSSACKVDCPSFARKSGSPTQDMPQNDTSTDPTENSTTVNAKLSLGSLLLLPLVFVTLHFSYGLGSLWGLVTLPFWRGTKKTRVDAGIVSNRDHSKKPIEQGSFAD